MVHDFISWVTTSYLEKRDLEDCKAEFKALKAQQAAKKDAQAAMARRHPLINQARSLAYDIELIDDLGDVSGHVERTTGFAGNESAKHPARAANDEVKAKADANPAGHAPHTEDSRGNESAKRPVRAVDSKIKAKAGIKSTGHAAHTESFAGNESAKHPVRVVSSNIEAKADAKPVGHTAHTEDFTGNESAKRRLRFNPRSRHTTKQQKKELYRRDAYCCQTPGCPNHVWLHVHHLTAFSEGGETVPENLVCLCSSCHKNLHDGHMAIEQNGDGQLIFKDAKGNRLDRFHDLELANWLDHWLGWCGLETNSYSMRVGLGQLQISRAYFDDGKNIKAA